jgi:iron complex transport system permease protein
MGRLIILLGLVALALGAGWAALQVGPDGWGTGLNGELLFLRLPRVVAALVAGAALGAAGAAQQGLFRNPLADPGLTGVFGGALLGVTALVALGGGLAWEKAWLMPVAAASGALAATLALVAFARGRSPSGLLLAGLGINALAGAATVGLTAWVEESRSTLAMVQTGSWLSHVTLELVLVPALAALLAILGLWVMSRRLDVLGLGESGAWMAGVDPGATGRQAAVLTSVAAGAATCICGQMAFVGLLAPHLARAVVGPRHAWSLPTAATVGALIVLAADTAGRLALLGKPLPASALVALVGAPAFLWLAKRHV